MRYKGFELREAEDRENELYCGVEFENPDYNDDISEEMEDNLFELLADLHMKYEGIYIEQVLDNYILVRCDDITFDEKGVDILKQIYDTLTNSDLEIITTVNIHLDDWFISENGKDCNEDEVSWEEFIENLKY